MLLPTISPAAHASSSRRRLCPTVAGTLVHHSITAYAAHTTRTAHVILVSKESHATLINQGIKTDPLLTHHSSHDNRGHHHAIAHATSLESRNEESVK